MWASRNGWRLTDRMMVRRSPIVGVDAVGRSEGEQQGDVGGGAVGGRRVVLESPGADEVLGLRNGDHQAGAPRPRGARRRRRGVGHPPICTSRSPLVKG